MSWKHELARDRKAVDLLDAFVVSAVASLMAVRLYLFLAGYPKVGGGGLHIAHMIWGGLLMLVSIIVGFSLLTNWSRWVTATVGGLGFGLFIDEIGKFVTSDNNYFFRPAAALIYVIFVALFMLSRAIMRRQSLTEFEYIMNTIELLKESAANQLHAQDREAALAFLARSGSSPLVEPLQRLFESLPIESELSPFAELRGDVSELYLRLARTGWFPRVVALIVVAGSLFALAEVAVILAVSDSAWGGNPGSRIAGIFPGGDVAGFISWLEIGAAIVAVLLALAGMIAGAGRLLGLRLLEFSVLVGILLVQPFAFYEAQFFASAGMVIGLPTLALVQYSLRQETRRELAGPPTS